MTSLPVLMLHYDQSWLLMLAIMLWSCVNYDAGPALEAAITAGVRMVKKNENGRKHWSLAWSSLEVLALDSLLDYLTCSSANLSSSDYTYLRSVAVLLHS